MLEGVVMLVIDGVFSMDGDFVLLCFFLLVVWM